MDLCECRRTIEKVLRDKNRASGRIRNRIRRRLYLTENCEIAKYKKTFPIRRFLSQRYTSAPPVHLCQHAPVYLGDSSSQWRNASVCLWTWLVAAPEGSVPPICLLTGCSVTNQLPGPHCGNQIATHSLWTSAGHLEIPAMFYLPLTHTHTHQCNLSVFVFAGDCCVPHHFWETRWVADNIAKNQVGAVTCIRTRTPAYRQYW